MDEQNHEGAPTQPMGDEENARRQQDAQRGQQQLDLVVGTHPLDISVGGMQRAAMTDGSQSGQGSPQEMRSTSGASMQGPAIPPNMSPFFRAPPPQALPPAPPPPDEHYVAIHSGIVLSAAQQLADHASDAAVGNVVLNPEKVQALAEAVHESASAILDHVEPHSTVAQQAAAQSAENTPASAEDLAAHANILEKHEATVQASIGALNSAVRGAAQPAPASSGTPGWVWGAIAAVAAAGVIAGLHFMGVIR